MENTKPKEILENIINVMEKTNVDEWEIDKLVVVLNYINELEKENKLLKETKFASQFPNSHCTKIKINTYKDRIDKAIELIEKEMPYVYEIDDYNETGDYFWKTYKKYDYKKLIDILKGEDNE